MSTLLLNAYRLVISLTIFVTYTQGALAETFIVASKDNSQNETKVIVSSSVSQGSKIPDKPDLILDNKDILKNLSRPSVDGPRISGGGNSCSLAITQNTRKLMELLRSNSYSVVPNVQALFAAIENAKFYLQKSLFLNGQAKDAINYPGSGSIYLSVNFCESELAEASGRSMSLLLHEYLGLARIDDQEYQVSGKFFEAYMASVRQQNIFKEFLQGEVEKDIQGQKSCFEGAIKNKKDGLSARYGDRSFTDNIGSVVISSDEQNASRDCRELLDEKFKPTQNAANAKYKVCYLVNNYSYIASVQFGLLVSDSYSTRSEVFKIQEARAYNMIVKIDDKYQDAIGAVKVSPPQSTYKCMPATLNLK